MNSSSTDTSGGATEQTRPTPQPAPPPTVTRPAKRARQRLACEPCRRKKSKCDYMRPACAFCSRLGQNCYYADESIQHFVPPTSLSPQVSGDLSSQNQQQNEARKQTVQSKVPQNYRVVQFNPTQNNEGERLKQTEERLQMLESRLAEVVGLVGQQGPAELSRVISSPARSNHAEQASTPLAVFDSASLPAWDIVRSVTETYLECCDCQPLPLFHPTTFINSLPNRDPEILFSVLALALRFSTITTIQSDREDVSRNYAETARRLVMGRVSNGPIELSTLQSLCLLSLVDFTNGNKNRASIHSSLAMNLAHCSGLTTESSANLSEVVREERRRCFWSIFLLKRLHGADVNVLDFSGEENFPWYPKTTGTSSGITELPPVQENIRNGELKDLGVVAYAVQQSEVWFKTTRYARRRATPSNFPPWSPQSEYSIITAQTMDFETRMPSKHRYKPSGFAQKPPEELQSNRAYWAPWLFCQFVYHTNLCLLNHPLILALRLRTFKHSMPEMFLQHTSDLISTHANWVVYLIDTLASKSFKVTDPFLGYCAAIVATIFLQESFSEDDATRREKQINFGKCFDFIRSFALEWPHIARLADKLQRLQDTVSASYHVSTNPQAPSRGLLVDLGRFWEVLEYSSASEVYDSAEKLFGPSLYSRPRYQQAEVTDMSPLPTPTRLEAAAGLSSLRGGLNNSSLSPANLATPSSTNQNNYMTGDTIPPISVMDHAGTSNYYDGFLPQESVYSSDELAVLADSFFNQREGYLGSMDELWRSGNL